MTCCCEWPRRDYPTWASVLIHNAATGEILHGFSRSHHEGKMGTCGEEALCTWVEGGKVFAACDYVKSSCSQTTKLYLLTTQAEVVREADNDEVMMDNLRSGFLAIQASPDKTKVVVVQRVASYAGSRVVCYDTELARMWSWDDSGNVGLIDQVDVSDEYVLLSYHDIYGVDGELAQLDITDGSLLWTATKDSSSQFLGPEGGVIVGDYVYAAWNDRNTSTSASERGMRVLSAADGSLVANHVDSSSQYVRGTVHIDGNIYMAGYSQASQTAQLWQYDLDGNLSKSGTGLRSNFVWASGKLPYLLSSGYLLWEDSSGRAVLVDPSSMVVVSTGTTSDLCAYGWVSDGGYMSVTLKPVSLDLGLRRHDNTMAVDTSHEVVGFVGTNGHGPTWSESYAGLTVSSGGLLRMDNLLSD